MLSVVEYMREQEGLQLLSSYSKAFQLSKRQRKCSDQNTIAPSGSLPWRGKSDFGICPCYCVPAMREATLRSLRPYPISKKKKKKRIHRSNCFLLEQLKPTDCKRLSFWYKTQIEFVMLVPHKYSTLLFSLLFKSSPCQCLGLLQMSEHGRSFLLPNSF